MTSFIIIFCFLIVFFFSLAVEKLKKKIMPSLTSKNSFVVTFGGDSPMVNQVLYGVAIGTLLL